MLTKRQLQICSMIAEGLDIVLDSTSELSIIQTPGYIRSHVEVDDICVAIMSVLGQLVAKTAELRGLGSQKITIDRRHAGLMLNSIAYHFHNGWQFDIGPVHTPINNFYETKDNRWIFYNGAYEHLREGLLNLLNTCNNPVAIASVTKQYQSNELEDLIAEKGLCAAIARTREEWLSHPQGKILASQPVIQLVKIAEGSPEPFSTDVTRPFEKINVLDFSKVIAGPTLSRQLADYGADVIHCRHPYQDHIPAFEIETSYGKLNTYINYRDAADRELLFKLLEDCDVVVDGYRTGAMDKAALGYQDLLKIKNNLVYVRLNGYGFDGPWTGRRGWEQLAQSTSGLAYAHLGSSESRPGLIPAYFNDYLTGYLGAIGTMAALMRRAQEGGSWLVSISLTRTAMLATQFIQGNGTVQEITQADLEEYLVDQESPIGQLTRVAPPIQFSETPAMSIKSASYPGSDTLGIGWGPYPICKISPPHRPTQLFRNKLAHFKGNQAL